MNRCLSVLPLLFLVSATAHADRITQMNRNDLCTYTAQLQVAAHHYFTQGKPRSEVSIKWHGDETQNEIEFVNQTVADAYIWLTKWKEVSNEPLPAQYFGDMVYQTCMTRKEL